MGMLSKNQTMNDDLAIVRNRSKVFCFDVDTARTYVGKYPQVYFGYIADRVKAEDISYNGKMTCTISGPFSRDNLFDFPGRDFKGWRRTINAFADRIMVSDVMLNPSDVVDLVTAWNAAARDRHFRLFSGYDKNFFQNQYFGDEKDRLQCLFFYDKQSMRCVGFSVLSLEPDGRLGVPTYRYVIGKYLPDKDFNNLSFYLDLLTFQRLALRVDGEFLIHWGASDGGVHRYKTEKFRHFLFDTYPVWSGKINQPDFPTETLF
jgi:hypothetical protein